MEAVQQAERELGLHLRPVGMQLPLALPVEQDMVVLPALTGWEKMVAEYGPLGLHPQSQIVAYLRPQLGEGVQASRHLRQLREGAKVKLAGLVVSRQRPGSANGVVFLALLDEYGLTPVVVWPGVFARYHTAIKERLVVEGTVSRRDGTLSVIMDAAIQQSGAVDQGQEIFDLVKFSPLYLVPPERVCVVRAFTKRLKPGKGDELVESTASARTVTRRAHWRSTYEPRMRQSGSRNSSPFSAGWAPPIPSPDV